jgi:hypothetical protein
MEFSKFFKRAFLQWQLDQEEPRTVTEFSEWLGVSQQNASNWIRGTYKPRKMEDISRLAQKLGFEVYDALGLVRPLPSPIEETLERMINSMKQLPPDIQEDVREAIVATVARVMGKGEVNKSDVIYLLAENLVKQLEKQTDPRGQKVIDG